MSEDTTGSEQAPTQPELAQLPSANYDTAKGTLVYRLSELVFGSLLAAYILGFVSFGAGILSVRSGSGFFYSEFSNEFGLAVLQFIIYISISCTYSYITAAIYLRYHVGILTMPTAAIERSRLDFSIAVLQAVLFGISMLFPQSFFACVAILLIVTALRQQREFGELTNHFANKILSQQNERMGPLSRKEELLHAIKVEIGESNLTGWSPISSSQSQGTIALAIVGIGLFLFPSWDFLNAMEFSYHIYAVASIILLFFVLKGGLDAMKEGSRFIHGRSGLEDLDRHYLELEEKLKKLPQTLPRS